MRTIFAFIVAVFVTFTLASVASTQLILNELAAMGAPVSLGLRASQSVADWAGLALSGSVPGLFPGIVAAGFLAAFAAAGLVNWMAPGFRALVYAVAGGVAMIAIFVALENALGTRGLFGARGGLGLALQALAGATGGLAFARLTRRE
jgi:hypothetical protein